LFGSIAVASKKTIERTLHVIHNPQPSLIDKRTPFFFLLPGLRELRRQSKEGGRHHWPQPQGLLEQGGRDGGTEAPPAPGTVGGGRDGGATGSGPPLLAYEHPVYGSASPFPRIANRIDEENGFHNQWRGG
jgi:hypothetical protein